MNTSKTDSKLTMADLMAKIDIKPLRLNPGDQVEGQVIALNETEVVLDLGGKAEGIISKKEFSKEQLGQLKEGDSLQVYVVGENNFGQINLTIHQEISQPRDQRRGLKPEQVKKWQKLINCKQQKTPVTGRVLEINKGGLLVDVNSLRGFLPVSQISLKDFGGSESGLQGLVGKELRLYVLETDMKNNKLILSTREEANKESKENLSKYQIGQQAEGKIAAIAPFGLIIDLGDDLEGVIYSQETSWSSSAKTSEDKDDLLGEFKVGQEIKVKVIGIDENLGRVNLSIRRLTEDPFGETASQFQADDVITGIVREITSNGTTIQLENGIEGFIPTSKIESGTEYQIGQKTNFLVDSVDMGKRRINLAPLLTSTKGLIYK